MGSWRECREEFSFLCKGDTNPGIPPRRDRVNLPKSVALERRPCILVGP